MKKLSGSIFFALTACILTGLAQGESAIAADKDGSYKLNLNKTGPGRRIFVPVKVQSVFRPVEGSIAGQPFKLVRATASGTTVRLEGQTPVVIEFASAQQFVGQTYQICYNTRKALTEKGQVPAPKITYTVLDKNGTQSTVTATNGAKDDSLDYAMELKFYPLNEKGERHGYIRLQIGTNPVSEIKGDFFPGR
ncbi:MAG: hypothetical protein JSS83_08715 [Cyanobacteria bacterium SZAS LIN-3]|nr:hypothetical protein [Cyanobacteria bacterium SZAS LIN-3]